MFSSSDHRQIGSPTLPSVPESFRGLLRQSGGLVVARIGGTTALLVTDILLARNLSTSAFGIYQVIGSLVAIGVLIGNWGWSSAAIKYLSAFRARHEYGLYATFEVQSVRAVITSSLCVAVLAACLGAEIYGGPAVGGHSAWVLYAIGSAAIPLLSVAQLVDGGLQASGRVVLGQAPLSFGLSGSLLVVVSFLVLVDRGIVTLLSVLSAELLIAAAILGLLLVAYRKARPKGLGVLQGKPPRWVGWPGTALRLGGVAFVATAFYRVDNLIVGVLFRPEDVAVYAVGSRLASAVALVTAATEMAIAPRVAKEMATVVSQDLRAEVRRLVRLAGLCSLAVCFVVLIFRRSILAMFGPGYLRAGAVTVVLVGTQVVTAVTGPAKTVLAMGREEGWLLRAGTLALIGNVILSVIFARLIGLLGVAVGTGISLVGWNAASAIASARRCGLSTLPF